MDAPDRGGVIRLRSVRLPDDVTLVCREAGHVGPRVLLLHGFPEAAFVWDEVMAALAPRARCLAPNLRGFAPSSAPAEPAAYHARRLVGDLAALIEEGGGPLDLLVAHDWGGAVAWSLAARRPDLLRRLLIINSPHPATFLRELRDNPAQQAASAYMNFLCRPDAEDLLAADDFRRLWRFLVSPWWTPSESERADYRRVWQAGLTGALNYYRASPLRPAACGSDAIHRIALADADVRVTVPTHVLWGEADAALLPGLLDGLERWVPTLTVTRVAQASHWIVHEQPRQVLAAIDAALD